MSDPTDCFIRRFKLKKNRCAVRGEDHSHARDRVDLEGPRFIGEIQDLRRLKILVVDHRLAGRTIV